MPITQDPLLAAIGFGLVFAAVMSLVALGIAAIIGGLYRATVNAFDKDDPTHDQAIDGPPITAQQLADACATDVYLTDWSSSLSEVQGRAMIQDETE